MKKQTRLGEHSDIAQQLVKFTPWAAIASIVGVTGSVPKALPTGLDTFNWSAPTSSRMMNKMLCLLLPCSVARATVVDKSGNAQASMVPVSVRRINGDLVRG